MLLAKQSIRAAFPSSLPAILPFILSLLLLLIPFQLQAQVNTGELRLKILDQQGHSLQAVVTTLASHVNGYQRTFSSDDDGTLNVSSLTFGVYLLETQKSGFAPVQRTIEIRSALPREETIILTLASLSTVVSVHATQPIIDPSSATSVMKIGEQEIADRAGSLPGRSLQDLVNSQPGWLYEGNAVLHPRGSEYQTQFVIDGIPLTDNRSPSFGPEIEAEDVESLSIFTAGIPAEYGRKMGGIVELTTSHADHPGTHGAFIVDGGSYDALQGFAELQHGWKTGSAGVTASGSMSSHYLNPVVPENYTNRGTTGDFSARLTQDLSQADTLDLTARHSLSRFEIPNELLQEQAGQLQTGANAETLGILGYRHIFSPDALATFSSMFRNNSNQLDSNANSTPIIAFQNNNFSEAYFKSTFSLHHGIHEFKVGLESDNTFLHENFNYLITDPTQFDDGTPTSLGFQAARPDLEQSAFIEDQIHRGNWTLSAGLRYDHYQLLLNQSGFSPRISLGRYFPRANLVLHASYDRVFQTPSFENILISSSPAITALDPSFLRLPVQPSRGNYFEGGLTKGFFSRITIAANIYRRNVNDYADDDQLLNTGVSYPISFDHAVIYGAEGKLEIVKAGPLTGFVSYSYMVGNVWFPVNGGLFLGDDAAAAASQLSGHFPDSQDQRNTLRSRFRIQATKRLWFASGVSFGSGLPFDYGGDEADALATYGPAIVNSINFDRGRIHPSISANATLGADLYHREQRSITFQADADNLTNHLNVIDFGGLFSGNAIGPKRDFSLKLATHF